MLSNLHKGLNKSSSVFVSRPLVIKQGEDECAVEQSTKDSFTPEHRVNIGGVVLSQTYSQPFEEGQRGLVRCLEHWVREGLLVVVHCQPCQDAQHLLQVL